MEKDHASLKYQRALFWVPFCSTSLYVIDMFLFLHEVKFAGYADDNTPFVVRDNIQGVISAIDPF